MLELSFDPLLNRPLRVLCLGAHSDDIEIGCGGTIMRLIASRRLVEMTWVVFSSGAKRGREARASAELFLHGASKKRIIIKNFRNAFFPQCAAQIKEFFETLKKRYSPDLVFTHCRQDLHQDHRTLCELTWNTFRNHSIFEYEIPKYDGDLGSPNSFVALDPETCRRKIAYLLRVFGTQRGKHWFTPDTFEALLRIRGLESCSPTRFAEAFYVRKLALRLEGEARHRAK